MRKEPFKNIIFFLYYNTLYSKKDNCQVKKWLFISRRQIFSFRTSLKKLSPSEELRVCTFEVSEMKYNISFDINSISFLYNNTLYSKKDDYQVKDDFSFLVYKYFQVVQVWKKWRLVKN